MTAPRSFAWLRAFAILWLGLLAGFAAGIEWIRTRPKPPAPSGGIDLVGAGATFPYPLYRRWFAEYGRESGARINYLSLGSGEGLRLLLDGEVDFGATDRPLRPEELARASCGPLVIPTVAGSIAVVVNLPTVRAPVRLDPAVLAGIYVGTITRWDAAPLRALNPGIALPAIPIRPAHRARSSGTSEVFAEYLASATTFREHREARGGTWPVGDAVEGSEGMATQVRVTEGAIGFVEHAYAVQARLAVAALQNRAGAFVLPDSASLAATMSERLAPEGSDTLASLVGARGAGAYPVVALTRLVADRALGDSTRARHLLSFARWTVDEGAGSATKLGYAPLPPEAARAVRLRLDRIRPGHCPGAR